MNHTTFILSDNKTEDYIDEKFSGNWIIIYYTYYVTRKIMQNGKGRHLAEYECNNDAMINSHCRIIYRHLEHIAFKVKKNWH